MSRRVVVTGMGAVTPIGLDLEDFWQNLKKGICGIDFITKFDTSEHKVKIAAEVKDFDPSLYLDRKESRRLDLFCQYAFAATAQAIKDSGLDLEKVDKERFGVIIGSGIGGMIITNMASGNISIKYGLKGICSSVVTACATGTHSIGDSFRAIKHGYADLMICGGTEAPITPLALAGFINITALTQNDNPKDASKPFDLERSGFVMGEGAGILVLEDYEHAVKRGAKIYAEVLGYGATGDAYHMTAPDPDGSGAARAMKLALEEGGISPEQVNYINAHGTSTKYNDKTETMAIKSVFGNEAYKIPVSSIKGHVGHLLGAAGAVEAIASIKSITESFIPPTLGLQNADPECDLDYVPNEGRSAEVKYALSNSLGFGGHNGTLLFGKVE
jgi:3-oxoacyl-[acyl-carrier-protein] synthase II